jgi:hypothetical protein
VDVVVGGGIRKLNVTVLVHPLGMSL